MAIWSAFRGSIPNGILCMVSQLLDLCIMILLFLFIKRFFVNFLDKKNAISIIGILVILMNCIFHLTGNDSLIAPFSVPSVMTIYTSISLIFIFIFFIVHTEKVKGLLLGSAFLLQLASAVQYFLMFRPKWNYLLSSSLPTTAFICLTIALLCCPFEKIKNYNKYKGPFMCFICLFLVFVYLNQSFFILGITEGQIGIGLSLYTLICFIFVSISMCIHYSSLISLDNLKIKFKPITASLLLVSYSLVSFLLLFCTGGSRVTTAILTHVLFLSLIFYYTIFPFFKMYNKMITICSWSQKIKNQKGEWVEQYELLKSLGFEVSHGISPEGVKIYKDQMKGTNTLRR